MSTKHYVINELGMGVGQMKWIRLKLDVELPKIFLSKNGRWMVLIFLDGENLW